MNEVAAFAFSLPALPAGAVVPAMVAARGNRAAWRYLEFFAARIRNPNTRAAYARAASAFFAWCEGLGLALHGISRCMWRPGSSSWTGKGGWPQR